MYISKMYSVCEQLTAITHQSAARKLVRHVGVPVITAGENGTLTTEQSTLTDSIICGDNPYLWARLVYNMRAYNDSNGYQHLVWDEALNHSIYFGEGKYDLQERHWTSQDK